MNGLRNGAQFVKRVLGVGMICTLSVGILGCPGFNLNNLFGDTGDNGGDGGTDPNTMIDPNAGGGDDGNDGVDGGDGGDGGDNSDLINSGLTGKYAGSEICSLCHVTRHADWAQTLHGNALDSLKAIGQDTNPTCIPCHTVGYGEEGGYTDEVLTQALAHVGCEACHGPAQDHVDNVIDRTKRPTVDISSEVCGKCHTGSHHPHIDEWSETKKARVDSHVADYVAVQGQNLSRCGVCHSGYFFYESVIKNETVEDDALAGADPNTLLGIECAICHDPHAKTGNAVEPEDGRDFQLRYPEARNPAPANSINEATDPTRFNLCGQCHHSRGRDWTATSRGPHHSVQSNIYVGEMPMPDNADDSPSRGLVDSRVSVHSFAAEQCATCHMYREDFMSEQAPAIAGHSFEVNQNSCATAGCHPNQEQALAAQTTLQNAVMAQIGDIRDALDAWGGGSGTWEYTSDGGPDSDGQEMIPDAIKQARFLLAYVESDGSYGLHNPGYVRDMLNEAEDLIAAAPPAP